MLQHSITIHKTIGYNTAPVHTRKDKLQYALWLDSLPMGQGSIILHKSLVADHNTHSNAFFEVQQVQELHQIVEYEGSEPKALYVKNAGGHAFWTIPSRWRVATTEDLKWRV